MSYRNYTLEQLQEAIKNCFSWRETAYKIGLNGDGGSNSKTLKTLADKNNYDYSHFKGKKWQKGKEPVNAIPLSELLVNGKICKSASLKKKLIKQGHLENKCSCCGIKNEWNGKKLELELDHIDGDRANNLPDNLRLLCPNCHSQTPTYCRNNKKQIKIKIYCGCCNKEINKKSKSKLCSSCFNKQRDYSKFRKVERPEKDILLEQIKEFGYTGTGRIYKVSATTIRKWIKAGVEKLVDS